MTLRVTADLADRIALDAACWPGIERLLDDYDISRRWYGVRDAVDSLTESRLDSVQLDLLTGMVLKRMRPKIV